jgi:hypothetical protein
MSAFIGSVMTGQDLNLRVEGDSENGFIVDIYSGNKALVKNSEVFSIEMYNLDMSVKSVIPH